MHAYRFLCSVTFVAATLSAQSGGWPLDSLKGIEPVNVKAEVATYRGKQAVHVQDKPGPSANGGIAILSDSDFGDGVIEVDVAGAPGAGAAEAARGFVGLAFRLQDASHYECFYLRPTNGRANDQLRRNHS